MKAELAREVAAARQKQHLSALQYYCALNALQHRKRVAMMEPMLGFARGQVGRRRVLKHCHRETRCSLGLWPGRATWVGPPWLAMGGRVSLRRWQIPGSPWEEPVWSFFSDPRES